MEAEVETARGLAAEGVAAEVGAGGDPRREPEVAAGPDLDDAVVAAEAFVETAERPPGVTWEADW